MKVRIVSDLHLEFYKKDDFKLEVSENESNTILLLAGDIAIATKMKRFNYFFEDISKRFFKVLYIAGNHEYYGGNYLMTSIKIADALEPFNNIHFLENQRMEIDNIVFICATLWTDFNDNDPICMFDAKHKMNDYKTIRHGSSNEPWRRKFSPEDAYVIHKTSKEFIFKTLKHKDENKTYIVMTHMAPSELSVSPEFEGDRLNGAYVSNLEEDILNSKPDFWFHGHVHSTFDYMLGDTRIICNPAGYVEMEENPNFDPLFSIEL